MIRTLIKLEGREGWSQLGTEFTTNLQFIPDFWVEEISCKVKKEEAIFVLPSMYVGPRVKLGVLC